MSRRKTAPPTFHFEDDERTFWKTHDSTDYVDWTAAEEITLPELKPTTTISLRLRQRGAE